ncbi:stage II sporulation protein M [Staphylospora marina]|uniref:stage II sporulation protein M n=1 Tax=Staphylospora marina TaxID=2490858 RepID=UPI000F5BD976|nr:stage II sporulation protein M [Staphylospora marina]
MKAWITAVKEELRYIPLAAMVLLVSAVTAGFKADGLMMTLSQSGFLDALEQLAEAFEQNPTFLQVFFVIFINNVLATLQIIASGLFLGVGPFAAMLVHGILIGVLTMEAAEKTGTHPLMLVVTHLLPHGIFEIPALLIAAAFGFRISAALFRRFLAVFSPERMEASREEWLGIRRRLPHLLKLMFLLLLVAALIESALIVINISHLL